MLLLVVREERRSLSSYGHDMIGARILELDSAEEEEELPLASK
jgi:hypothetical protein